MKTFKIFNAFLLSSFLIMAVGCSKEDPMQEDLVVSDAHIAPEDVANNGAKAKMYSVEFGSLNNSGVSGSAELSLEGSTLRVSITATGLHPEMLHPQHIHGFADDKRNSTCPPESADTSGDGLISVGEGAPFYGGIQLPLIMDPDNELSFPVADAEGNINFTMTYEYEDGIDNDITPLQNRAIVL
ncbi:MAG: hypothetical protein R3214_14620, partial [Christiangramia sp.]|nr:hypothetical protein [Christiangramia sp.]